MRYVLLVICCFCCSVAFSQSAREIDIQFAQKRYELVLTNARQLMEKEPTNAFAYEITGAVYVREGKYDSSIPFSQKAIQLDNDSTHISGWAHVNLGTAYVNTNNKEKGVEELKRAITLGTTLTSTRTATRILDSIGYKLPEKEYAKDYLPDWVIFQSPVLTYKFQDTTGCTAFVYKFIQAHDSAYRQLKEKFQSTPPARPIMHVWSDPEIAKQIIHHRLGFAFSKECFCHVSKNQSVGHELAHILSYWSWGTQNTGKSKFITEGIGVCFDLEPSDKYAIARNVVARYKVETIKVWENEKDYDDDVLYPLGGAFVQYMYEHSTPEQFRLLVKQQTLENVKLIYGAKFNTMVSDFNRLMGIQG